MCRWTVTWNAPPITSDVYASAVLGSDLYVAGSFSMDEAGYEWNYILKRDASGTWSRLQQASHSGFGVDDTVNVMKVSPPP